MKYFLVLAAVLVSSSLQAESKFNTKNSAQLKALREAILGEDTSKQVLEHFKGKTPGGEECELTVRNTRFGFYFSLSDRIKDKTLITHFEVAKSSQVSREYKGTFKKVGQNDHFSGSQLRVEEDERGLMFSSQKMELTYRAAGEKKDSEIRSATISSAYREEEKGPDKDLGSITCNL